VKTGEGFDAWLDEVTQSSDAGKRLAEVDYDIYAEGEAVLGWLNATIALRGETTEWNVFAENLLKGLSQRFDNVGAAVGHVKLIIEAGNNFLMGNLTGKGGTLSIRGSVDRSTEAQLTLNARVQMSPEALEVVARDVINSTCKGLITATPRAWRCLRPGRPKPTHRYDHVVTVKKA